MRLVQGAQDYQLSVFGLLIIVITIGVPRHLVGLRSAVRKAYLG
jgi:ABC-type branched-subunit amino acid transport system permease subunit